MPSSRTSSSPNVADIKKWNAYLANERTEAAIYQKLAARTVGDEREIFLALASAEARHEQHWINLLGPHAQEKQKKISRRVFLLECFSRLFGAAFTFALLQRFESKSPYATDLHATSQMSADEHVHQEVIRALAHNKRTRLSETFRAAIFGLNDGLVSNLALILGVYASGAQKEFIILAGISGLLAGALSMAAGEYISVRSQRELLEASHPSKHIPEALSHLDLDQNELMLIYRARGMNKEEATERAQYTLSQLHMLSHEDLGLGARNVEAESLSNPWRAAQSSFFFFAIGALIPLLSLLTLLSLNIAIIFAIASVGLTLLMTGSIVGVFSGTSLTKQAFRQLAIGYGAAALTYALGIAFGAVMP